MTLTRKQYRALQRNLDDAVTTIRARILHPDRDPITAAHDIRAIVQAARDPEAPLPENVVRDFIALGEQGPGPYPGPRVITYDDVAQHALGPDHFTRRSGIAFTPPRPAAHRTAGAVVQDLIDNATPHQRGLLADTARNTPPAIRIHTDGTQTLTLGNPPLLWWDDPYAPGARPLPHESANATDLATGNTGYTTDNTMDEKFGGGAVSPRARARRGRAWRAVRAGLEALRQSWLEIWDRFWQVDTLWLMVAGLCLIGFVAFLISVSQH